MEGITVIAHILILYVAGVYCHYECDKNAKICETSLIISHTLTLWHPVHQYVLPKSGKLYKYDVTNFANPIPLEEVISADGWGQQRMVIVANNSMPGPNIIVYEGQKIRINVINELNTEVTSIHWHGIRQTGTPWMDGAAYITQCPILPGHSFTYEFIADLKGSYMYHSHMRMQRSDGLIGSLIVREKNSVMKEHILMIQGWNHDQGAQKDYQGVLRGHFFNGKEVGHSVSLSGAEFDKFRLTSVLINGRGRYYDPETGFHNGAPVSVLEVESGQQYRLRLIGGGSLYPYRISIDNHTLTIISSDGHDIQPVECESLVITTGERYDVLLKAVQPISNYWIRAETLEVIPTAHHAEAILRYVGAPYIDANTQRKHCTRNDKCVLVNCPFKYYPPDQHIQCKTFDELRSSRSDTPAPTTKDQSRFKEYFLNFAFPGSDDPFPPPGSVNGRVFKIPKVSALSQPTEIESICENAGCAEDKLCECTYSISLNHGDVVQFVLTNMGSGEGEDHPIHMHGYSFHVLKMGFAHYNISSGQVLGPNADINCRGKNPSETFCNDATWSNLSWVGGNIPDLIIENAPKKDTLNIPTGSYAIIRIKVDNPGIWSMHCHIDIHSTAGMVLLLNSSFSLLPKIPEDFPECRQFGSKFKRTDIKCTKTDEQYYNVRTFWIVVVILIIVILCLVYAVIHMIGVVRRTRDKHNVSDGTVDKQITK